MAAKIERSWPKEKTSWVVTGERCGDQGIGLLKELGVWNEDNRTEIMVFCHNLNGRGYTGFEDMNNLTDTDLFLVAFMYGKAELTPWSRVRPDAGNVGDMVGFRRTYYVNTPKGPVENRIFVKLNLTDLEAGHLMRDWLI